MLETTQCDGFAEAESSYVEDSGHPIEVDAFPSARAALDALTPPDCDAAAVLGKEVLPEPTEVAADPVARDSVKLESPWALEPDSKDREDFIKGVP
jgi:hypothetical protein